MSYRFEQFAEREAKALVQAEKDDAEYAERRRLETRSTWEKIADLTESRDLKDVLWELLAKMDEELDQ